MPDAPFPRRRGASAPPVAGIPATARARLLRGLPRSADEQSDLPAPPTGGQGSGRRSGRLKALVEVDVEGSRARIGIKGAVDTRNVKAVYIVVRRANSLAPGLDIVLDLKRATVQPEAMEQLQECSEARRLPRRVDPGQSECRLRITPAARPARTPTGLALAA